MENNLIMDLKGNCPENDGSTGGDEESKRRRGMFGLALHGTN
jgi:hypothetical protein